VKGFVPLLDEIEPMFAFVLENHKLIMVFVLIATIIALSSFGNRPYRPEPPK
jgi:hypothetical protein